VLITGASRGLGLEHARQYADRGWRVIATARHTGIATPLGQLARCFPESVVVRSLDVTDDQAIKALASQESGATLDVLINNAGTYGPKGAPDGMAYQSLAEMDYSIWRNILEVNLLSPFRIAVAFRPHLLRGTGRLVVMMSSDLGSIGQNQQGGSFAYRSSKAGLNMITRGMASEWPDLTVIAMAPGWTRTELGGPAAPIEPEDSVRQQQQTFDRLTRADSGRFVNRFGAAVPW
jgi:NAD(P)-dependent dehydrogenase (short-subunit alcohol dehydrogenase family)